MKVAADADVADMYEQYDQLIENFKAVHKECEAVKSSGYREGYICTADFKPILILAVLR